MLGTQMLGHVVVTTILIGVAYTQTTCDPVIQADGTPSASDLAQCLNDVAAAASSLGNTVTPSGTDLSVFMEAMFTTQNAEFKACCDVLCATGGVYNLNPLDQTAPNNYELRNPPTFEFEAEAGSGIFVGDDNLYTLLMFDITSLDPALWVHWAVVNIPGLNVNGGQTVMSYFNPAVSVDYQFVLIRQSQPFTGNYVDYTDNSNLPPEYVPFCPDGRCNFDLPRYLQDVGGTIVGTTFTSVTEVDTFVFDARINDLNISPANVCNGQPGVTVNGDDITCSAGATTTSECNFDTGGSGRYGGQYSGHLVPFGLLAILVTFWLPV